MRWRWREPNAIASREPEGDSLAEAERSTQEALAHLEESFQVRDKATQQRRMGAAVADALSAIRAENHFQELWNQGLRGGQ